MSTRELVRKPPAAPVARPAARPAVAAHGPAHGHPHGHGHGHPHGHPHGHAHGQPHAHGHGHGHGPGHPHAHAHGHGHAHGVRRAVPAAQKPAWQLTAVPGQQLNILPGQLCFSTHPVVMRTLLGSCVSLTIWHPGRHIGGMCHFLLPQRERRDGDALDGRYGDEAVATLVELLQQQRTRPEEYHCHLYGGADTLPDGHGLKFNIGERNIERGWQLVDQYGFQLQGVDVGEDIARTVSLTLATGEVDMKRGVRRAPVVVPTAHSVRTVARR